MVCAALLLSPVGIASPQGKEDPVEAILRVERDYSPEHVRRIEEAIAAFPEDPRILELKYRRLGALMGQSLEEDYQRSIISQSEALAQACEAAGRQDLAFECQRRIGVILQHTLRDSQAAYKHYRGMEGHPALKNQNLPTDVRRMELYACLVETAWQLPERDKAAVRKYAQLVMAFNYFVIKDRNIYSKLRDAYTRAVGIYVQMLAMSGEIKTLVELEIPPSQRHLQMMRQVLVRHAIDPTGQATQVDNPNDVKRRLEALVKMPATGLSGSDTRPASHEPSGGGMKSPPHSPGERLAPNTEDFTPIGHETWPWIAAVAGVAVVVSVLVWWMQRKRRQVARQKGRA